MHVRTFYLSLSHVFSFSVTFFPFSLIFLFSSLSLSPSPFPLYIFFFLFCPLFPSLFLFLLSFILHPPLSLFFSPFLRFLFPSPSPLPCRLYVCRTWDPSSPPLVPALPLAATPLAVIRTCWVVPRGSLTPVVFNFLLRMCECLCTSAFFFVSK